jgi:hypothetical protein
MVDWWTVGVAILGAFGAAWAGVKYFAGIAINRALAREAERYKAELAAKTDVLKMGLGVFAHEQQVSISRVDSERAKAIREVYSYLAAWRHATTRLIQGCPLRNAQFEAIVQWHIQTAEAAHEATTGAAKSLSLHAIDIDEETYTNIASLSGTVGMATGIYLAAIRERGGMQGRLSEIIQILDTVERPRLDAMFRQEINPRYGNIVRHLRATLGVDRSNSIAAPVGTIR